MTATRLPGLSLKVPDLEGALIEKYEVLTPLLDTKEFPSKGLAFFMQLLGLLGFHP